MTLLRLRTAAVTSLFAFAFTLSAMAGGSFAMPKEGVPSFRRDRIPLEIAEMHQLARAVAQMATTVKDDKAKDRRLAAQCIALSLALQPRSSNPDARNLLREWKDGNYNTRRDPVQITNSLNHVVGLIEWLDSDAAGRDARILADHLKDVVSRVGHHDEGYRAMGAGHEYADWSSLVQPLSAFEGDDSLEEPKPDPKPEPDTDPQPEPDKGFQLTVDRAEVLIPMWYRSANPRNGRAWDLKPGRMFVTARFDENRRDQSFEMRVGGAAFDQQMAQFTDSMTRVLSKSLGGLPGGLQLDIGSEALEEALRSGQPQSISAATVVLAGAVIRGVEVDPKAIVIGRVDEQGRFLCSSDMWAKLAAFRGGKKQRLVVPKQAREYLVGMWVMDEIRFFIDYEVVWAETVEEMINAVALKPEGGLGEACVRFDEIQDFAPGENEIRGFVANIHTRKRLAKLVEDSSHHLSGAILLDQSLSKRPFNVSRAVLCSELLRIIEPLSQVEPISLDAAAERAYRRLPVGQMSQECREQVAALERYVGREERALYKEAEDLFDIMRDHQKDLLKSGDYDFITKLLVRSSRNAAEAYEAYAKRLEQAMDE